MAVIENHIDSIHAHTVTLIVPDHALDRVWDEILAWCESPDVIGKVSWETDYRYALKEVESDKITFMFSDPDAAFAFKMRWA